MHGLEITMQRHALSGDSHVKTCMASRWSCKDMHGVEITKHKLINDSYTVQIDLH
jgi:hypothetical protein